MWSKLKQSEYFPLLFYLYLLYSQQTSQTLFPNMSYQFDSIAHNIILQSVVLRQILTLNRPNTPHFRPKPARTINDRCYPSVLGRLPSRNLSCIPSNFANSTMPDMPFYKGDGTCCVQPQPPRVRKKKTMEMVPRGWE